MWLCLYVFVCVCVCMCLCVCVFGKGRPRRCATAFTQQLASSLAWLHIYTDLFPSSSKSSSPALFHRQHFVRAQSELISPFLGTSNTTRACFCWIFTLWTSHLFPLKPIYADKLNLCPQCFNFHTKIHILISVFDCNWSIFPQTKFWQWRSNSHSKILFQARQGWPDPTRIPSGINSVRSWLRWGLPLNEPFSSSESPNSNFTKFFIWQPTQMEINLPE